MNDNSTNVNNEEVPLDLFDQVNLEEYEPVEIVDLNSKTEEKTEENNTNNVISIPSGAYSSVIEREKAQNSN